MSEFYTDEDLAIDKQRKAELKAELELLDLVAEHRAAKEAYRADGSPKTRRAFEKARDAVVAARQGHRRAQGRPEGSGVA